MTGFNYRLIPGVKEFEDGVEQVLGAYKSIKGIGDYLDKNSPAIVEKMGRIVGETLSDIWDDMKSKVRISPSILEPLNKAYASSKGGGNGKGQYGAKPSAQKPAYQSAKQASQGLADPEIQKSMISESKTESFANKSFLKPAATPAPQVSQTPTKQAPQKPTTPPIVVPGAQNKSSALDDLVNDFKQKVKSINSSYDIKVDVYDNDKVIQSYAPASAQAKQQVASQQKTPLHKNTYLENLLQNADKKFIDDSIKVAEMYNNGYKTKWIINEAAKKGYSGINSYSDITDRVALSLDAGMSYTRGKYDNTISTKLGAKEQMINDYLAGKSYKEIKESLKSKTNGMTISDSSILRTMHKYEKESRKKVVGKRNGRGKGKNK